MAKKKTASPKVKNQKGFSEAGSRVIQARSEVDMIKNGLMSQALGAPDAGAGFPYNQGVPGTERVENTGTIFKNLRYYFISNFRQILNQMYVELGLVQTIVDVPVDDAFRGGIEITTSQLDEKEIRQLSLSLRRDGDLLAAAQACKWNRLFGGAGIIIVTDQDPDTELELESIGEETPLKFIPVDMWELFYDRQNVDGWEPSMALDEESESEFFSYYGEPIHKSRVMKLKGMEAPSFVRPRLRGWGFSVCEALVRSLNQYLKGTDLTFEVLDEFKLDVYKIKNLVNTLMSPNGKNKVRERIQLSNWTKNYQNAVVLDKEDDFDHKQLSFSGLAEAGAGIRMQVASDMRMPLTKLFGISAAGFNSGEDDLEVYNAMVESQVREKIEFDVVRIVEIKCQKLFNMIPDDLEINFKPLRVMSSEQEETVKTSIFNRVLAASTAGKIDDFEFRESVNKDSLLPVQLDTTNVQINLDDPDVAGEDDGGESVEKEPGVEEQDDEERDRIPKEKRDQKAKDAREMKPSRDPKPPKDEPSEKKSNRKRVATPPPFTHHEKIVNDSKYQLIDFDGPKIVSVGLLSGSMILTGKRRDNGLWTHPGGHMDAGETPEQAACREVLEETGIVVAPGELTLIQSQKVTSHRTGKDFVIFLYLANIERERATAAYDPDQEVSEWKWVALDPATPELMDESRHAKNDFILNRLFGKGI